MLSYRHLSAALCAALLTPFGAAAHEGHAHGDAPAALTVQTAPRASVTGTLFALVAVPDGGGLTIWIDRVDTNTPVVEAIVDVETPSGPATATAVGETYRLDAPWAAEAGVHDLLFTVAAGTDVDFLTASLTIPEAAPAAPPASIALTGTGMIESARNLAHRALDRLRGGDLALAAMGGAGFFAGLLVMALTRRRAVAATAVVALALVATLSPAVAAGPAEAAQAPVPVVRDVAQRMADGRIFAPKATQRILAIRTITAIEAEHRESLELPGRVIADPDASGFVQTAIGGRLSAPEEGFPSVGARVKAGQVMAWVAPTLAAFDRTDLRRSTAELDQEIAIAERQAERSRALAQSGNVSRSQLEEAELTLAGLLGRRATLDEGQLQPEGLVAPIDGVVSRANAFPGLIAETNTEVFHIVDPDRLWVETLSYGDATVGAAAAMSDGAGGSIALGFVGAGYAPGSQARTLQFRVQSGAGRLRLGQLVTVIASTDAPVTGIAAPREAVIRAANGEDIVYVHSAPELFEPRAVRTAPLDGARLLVVAGVAPGERIVTQGAELLHQLR